MLQQLTSDISAGSNMQINCGFEDNSKNLAHWHQREGCKSLYTSISINHHLWKCSTLSVQHLLQNTQCNCKAVDDCQSKAMTVLPSSDYK